MTMDPGSGMKARLRADLRAAMKEGRATEAKVIRSLVAAIDNAEARPICLEGSVHQRYLHSGSAEVERLRLRASQVLDVLLKEMQELERVAEELEHLKMPERAHALRAEANLAQRYIAAE